MRAAFPAAAIQIPWFTGSRALLPPIALPPGSWVCPASRIA
jgi:hypothetical protein